MNSSMPTGAALLKQPVIGCAANKACVLEDFANNSKLATAAFDEAIGQLARQIATAIATKAS